MALGSTQPLTEMSTGVFPGGKSGRSVRVTTLPPSCAVVMKSGDLNFLEPSGPPRHVTGLLKSVNNRHPPIYMLNYKNVVHLSPLCFFRLNLKLLPHLFLDLPSGPLLSYLNNFFFHFISYFLQVF
jgi:hypothetical protein